MRMFITMFCVTGIVRQRFVITQEAWN